MEKRTTFKWGWKDYDVQPDPLMTRARAARLLRAWRRSRIVHLKRRQAGIYRITHLASGETATMTIRAA